jgi:transposase InsO family protein
MKERDRENAKLKRLVAQLSLEKQSFNGKLRDECLNGEIFYSLKEAQVVIEKWRMEYNTKRPPSALGYKPLAPAACSPGEQIHLHSPWLRYKTSHFS